MKILLEKTLLVLLFLGPLACALHTEQKVEALSFQVLSGKSSAIYQILPVPSGGYVITGNVAYTDLPHTIVLRADSALRFSAPLYLDTRETAHLISLRGEEFAYTTDTPSMDKKGNLESRVEVRKLSLATGQQTPLFKQGYSFTAGYSNTSGWLPAKKVAETRIGRRPIYDLFALSQSPLQEAPRYYPGIEQVYLDRALETQVGDLRTGQSAPVQPLLWDPENPMNQVARLRPVDGAPGKYAAIVQGQELPDILLDKAAEDFQTEEDPKASYLVVAEINAEGWKEHQTIRLSHSGIALRTARYTEGKYLLAGSAGATHPHTWVGLLGGNTIHERTYDLPGISRATAIASNPTASEIAVVGTCDYTQASSGSVSNSSGFLLELNNRLDRVSTTLLRGKRSTVPRAVLVEPGRVIVGGTTQGPDTHSSDRTTRAFLTSVTHNKGDKP